MYLGDQGRSRQQTASGGGRKTTSLKANPCAKCMQRPMGGVGGLCQQSGRDGTHVQGILGYRHLPVAISYYYPLQLSPPSFQKKKHTPTQKKTFVVLLSGLIGSCVVLHRSCCIQKRSCQKLPSGHSTGSRRSIITPSISVCLFLFPRSRLCPYALFPVADNTAYR